MIDRLEILKGTKREQHYRKANIKNSNPIDVKVPGSNALDGSVLRESAYVIKYLLHLMNILSIHSSDFRPYKLMPLLQTPCYALNNRISVKILARTYLFVLVLITFESALW